MKQKNIASYENELELKSWNSKQEKYPDLILNYENGTKVWVEIERTRKTKERIENKLDNMRDHIKGNHKVIWVIPDVKIAKFIQEQINNYDWNKEAHEIEIFNYINKC